MGLKLSHSASTKYQECSRAYKYHYIDNMRSTVQSSALLFGTSIDKSAEHYANTKNFDETLEIFNNTWQTQEISGVLSDLRFLLNFTYSDKDLDTDLLKKDDWKLLSELNDDPEVYLYSIQQSKEKVGYKGLSDDEKRFFNYTNWLCLKRKGYYMLKEFKRVFDENVEEVLGTQVKVELENEDGDIVVGFADFVFKWKGIAKPVIFDLKTSARDYEEDSVRTSPQLSLYVFSLSEKFDNTRNAGYLVLNKNISKNKKKVCSICGKDGTGGRFKTCDAIIDNKRCDGEWNETFRPKARSQVIQESVSEILVERVLENFNDIGKAIKAEVFPRNFSNCIKYGVIKCAFYNLCHNNSMEEIECKEKNDKTRS